jgi:phosphonoacetaldehyde dehydrogenase
MSDPRTVDHLPGYVAGERVDDRPRIEIRYPYDGSVVGSVAQANRQDLEHAIVAGSSFEPILTRYERSEILARAGRLLEERRELFASSIRFESGLCVRETRYEVGRACDVLRFASIEALRDDGEIMSGDVTPQGKARKIFTLREPLPLVAAITPFNHPLNQVAHKVAPAIAAGAPLILKPSEKTPMTAIRFAALLYEAGLPGPMLSVLVGDIDEVVEPLIRDERVRLVTFTGGTSVGKRIAATAGYKKLCLELGGNSPLIVLEDADLDLAVTLAAEGAYRNSGQRCTAVKRLLVHESIVEAFTERLVARTAEYVCGDPADEATRVGTVINEDAAAVLERRVIAAERDGARTLTGGRRTGALMPPTVIAGVRRDAEMVCEESFGPLAPIMAIRDLDDAIDLANASAFGLSTGVVTNDLHAALEVVRRVRTGTVNVNEVPGYRTEGSPFGGIKDSGLGIKEGVVEAMRFMTTVKTFSLPW